MNRPDIEHLTHIAYVGDPDADPGQITRELLGWIKHLESELAALRAAGGQEPSEAMRQKLYDIADAIDGGYAVRGSEIRAALATAPVGALRRAITPAAEANRRWLARAIALRAAGRIK